MAKTKPTETKMAFVNIRISVLSINGAVTGAIILSNEAAAVAAASQLGWKTRTSASRR
jgi:hypothetical protein